LKLTPQEKLSWEEMKDKLQEVGIETNQFDEEAIAIQTQPTLLKNIENAVRILLAGDDLAKCDRATIAKRACKASIVTGDKLLPEQVEYQRKQLLACQAPFTCPHGRPTVIEITDGFLERQFLRT
jgi:DNA mismatch repair protein MutL